MTTRFEDMVDLAAERLGGAVVSANDEFFAPTEGMLKPTPAEGRDGVYTERGKWMDGWETRRRRAPGYDWCIVRLGVPGIVRGFVVDTSFFRGNFPESCSIEGVALAGVPDAAALEQAKWFELLPKSQLQGDSRNQFAIVSDQPVTHVRLNIFPDGGVARLRVHGEVAADWQRLKQRGQVDLAAVEHGARVVSASDMFFGHRHNLIRPGRGTHMGDGWETKRRRGPGHDWTIIKLGSRGAIARAEVDTTHFKGNAPDSCMLEVCDVIDALPAENVNWVTVLPRTPLQPHTRHSFDIPPSAATHARFSIFPDGGIGRLRLFGTVADNQ